MIAAELRGWERELFFHQPVGPGRADRVIQFVRCDDSLRGLALAGKQAVSYKETIGAV